MLARTGKLSDLTDAVERGYIVESKIDGIRCLAVVGDMGGVQLYNRQLRNITAAFPDACEQIKLRVRHPGPLVLDGELCVLGPDGLPNFQLMQHRANRLHAVADTAMAYPAAYRAFDVLSLSPGRYFGRTFDMQDYTSWSLQDRKRVLWDIAPLLALPTFTQEEADAIATQEHGEGLMLKHGSSRYYPGQRSPAWLKIKWLREIEAVIGGVTYGYGKREPYFGGLLVGVWLPSDLEGKARLQYIGTVGTGFDTSSLEALTPRLYALRTPACPFDACSSDWDIAWFVEPVLGARIKFAEYTRDGIMRFPRFVGLT